MLTTSSHGLLFPSRDAGESVALSIVALTRSVGNMTHRTGPGLFRLKHTVKALPFSSPLPPTPNRFHTLRAGGGESVCPVSAPHPRTHCTGEKRLAKSLNKNQTAPHRASVSSAAGQPCCPLPPLQLLTNSDHVPLWDRLPPMQVDPAPAHTLRHYF